MTYERERTVDHPTQSSATAEQLEPGRTSRAARLQRRADAEPSGLIARRPRDANGVADDAHEAVAATASSGGAALPAGLMRKFEASLGADLSGVRVHTGETSAVANEAVGARAYTLGNDIHFGAGQFDPSSSAGEHLLAHEVAHTVQQAGGASRVQFKLDVSSPGDAHELEADRAADAMVRGSATSVAGSAGVARVVARDKNTDTGKVVVNDTGAESINDLMDHASDESILQDKSKLTWSSNTVESKKSDGTTVDNTDNPIVANALKNGSMEDLRVFSEELDVIDPPILAWKAAHARADIIRLATDIDPEKPSAYEASFKNMKDTMKNQTGGVKNTYDTLVVAAEAHPKAALLQLQTAMHKLEAARARYQAEQNKLQLLAKQKEVQSNASATSAVHAQIATYTTVITTIGTVIGMMAGGIGMLANGSVAMESEMQAAIGDGAVDVKGIGQGVPKLAETGAGKVAGAGTPIKWFFENVVFGARLDQLAAQAAILATQVNNLKAFGIHVDQVTVSEELAAAKSSVAAAEQSKEDADRQFHTALIQAGRNFDQRNMSDAEKAKDDVSPKAHVKGEVTMEGLMSVYSTMVQRRQARQALLTAADNSPHLTMAEAKRIIGNALDSGVQSSDPIGQGVAIGTTSAIDDPASPGTPVQHAEAKMNAQSLKTSAATAIAHIVKARQDDPTEIKVEAAWDALVALGSGGLIGGQV